jgi:hypothetical protein
MNPEVFKNLFSDAILKNLFPAKRADLFFDAMYGDASEGAYDIELSFHSLRTDELEFHFHLRRRTGKCLTCNLTYGLPHVFSRHPVIDAQGLVNDIEKVLIGSTQFRGWNLGETREISSELHVIPLFIQIQSIA